MNEPLHGPWRIYTEEEESQMIRDSLSRQDKFCREWEERGWDGKEDV